MSKSSELDKTVKNYILDCIDGSGYDRTLDSNPEKIQFLRNTFQAEYGHMIKRVGPQKAMIEWLQGLPSSCNIEYRNHEILKLAVKWGSLPEDATEKQQEKILENWFGFIANKMDQLFRGSRLPAPKPEIVKKQY